MCGFERMIVISYYMEDWEKECLKDAIGSKIRVLESMYEEINLYF